MVLFWLSNLAFLAAFARLALAGPILTALALVWGGLRVGIQGV